MAQKQLKPFYTAPAPPPSTGTSKRGLDRGSFAEALLVDHCIICFADCTEIRPTVKDWLRESQMVGPELQPQLLNFHGSCCKFECWLKIVEGCIGTGAANAMRRRLEARLGRSLPLPIPARPEMRRSGEITAAEMQLMMEATPDNSPTHDLPRAPRPPPTPTVEREPDYKRRPQKQHNTVLPQAVTVGPAVQAMIE